MISFFRSLWPGTIPPGLNTEDEISVLRERILQVLLLSSLSIALIAFALVIPSFIQSQRWGIVVVFTLAIFLMVAMAFIRQIRFSVRAAGLLVVIYVIAFGGLLANGLSGNGPVLMASFVAITAIFLGLWACIAAGVLALGTLMTMGLLMAQNIIPAPPIAIQANATNIGEWFTHSLVIGLVGIYFIATLTILVNGLRHSLFSQKQLTKDLTNERDTLENRVQLRTTELERRAVEMETASQIASNIAAITDLDELLMNAVELIKREYQLYYAAVFLLDDRHEFAVLRSGTGEAGAKMLASGHRLKLVETSMVAFAILKNEVRLAQDVEQEAIHFKNPNLPDTLSELSLPLVVGGTTIGALDVQSDKLRYFQPDDIRVLKVAADQLAVAIDKARILQQLTQTLEDLRLNLQHTTQESWQGFMRLSRRSYNYQFRQGKAVESGGAISLQANEALSLGSSVIASGITAETGKPFTTVAIPIKLRDHVLGVIDLKFETQTVPANLLETLDTVSNRLAFALENARLLEEIRMRAERDRLVSNISAKVRAEANVDKVLQTVVLELGRSLSVSGVVVQLRSAD